MTDAARILFALSALVILALGCLHLSITFRGNKLHPRDPELIERMRAVSPVITRETTMWKTWIGFNASHSYGAMLFGLIYGYFAVVRPDVLFGSAFLLGVGAVLLAGYVVLGYRYWFSVPFRGIVVATLFYAAGIAANLA